MNEKKGTEKKREGKWRGNLKGNHVSLISLGLLISKHRNVHVPPNSFHLNVELLLFK